MIACIKQNASMASWHLGLEQIIPACLSSSIGRMVFVTGGIRR